VDKKDWRGGLGGVFSTVVATIIVAISSYCGRVIRGVATN
jgi:hypothetical protein